MNEIRTLDLKRAPLNEVVLGFILEQKGFLPVHYHQYWDEIVSEYTRVTSHPPIILRSPIIQEQNLPFPRLWYESEDGQKLIQLQQDRFHYNWRKLDGSRAYRTFETLLPEFLSEWERFLVWACQGARPAIDCAITHMELTYINHYAEEIGWNGTRDNPDFLSLFDITAHPTTLTPSAVNARCAFELADARGTLYATLQQATRGDDDKPVQVLDLTVRKQFEGDDLSDWYICAHNVIVDFFERITPKPMLDRWRN